MADETLPAPSESSLPRPTRYEEDERYLLHGDREIGHVLQALLERNAQISAHLAGRNLSYPTALLDYSPEHGTLVIDGSAIPAINRSLETASQVVCVSQLDKIHIQFNLSGLVPQEHDGQTSFLCRQPERLLKLQRREFYRQQVPVADEMTCIVHIPVPDAPPASRTLRVLDISGGGLALETPAGQPGLKAAQELPACQLNLPDGEILTIDLRVRNVFRQQLPGGKESCRAGCQFVRLPRSTEALIQRYIFRIERLRNARKQGLG